MEELLALRKTTSGTQSGNSGPFPLLSLPPEIILKIHAESLNPALLQVSRGLWHALETRGSWLQFCVAALRPIPWSEDCRPRLCKVQNWIVRRAWFDAGFAKDVDRVLSREVTATRRSVPQSETSQRDHDKGTDILPYAPWRRYHLRTYAQVTTNVFIPTKLLKGEWTEERLDFFERLLEWGARVFTAKPLWDGVPTKLLHTAALQGDADAIRFCRHRLLVKSNPSISEVAASQGLEDVISETLYHPSMLPMVSRI